MENNNLSESAIFPKGNKVEGPLKNYFTGNAWVAMLVADPEFNCPVYNVTFEPRARNNWHIHKAESSQDEEETTFFFYSLSPQI